MWRSTRHWVACSSNPGVGGIFFPFFGPFLFHLIVSRLSNHLKSPVPIRLGNPKAAAHVAVRPSVLVTVKYY